MIMCQGVENSECHEIFRILGPVVRFGTWVKAKVSCGSVLHGSGVRFMVDSLRCWCCQVSSKE